jgi:hypothetical protein
VEHNAEEKIMILRKLSRIDGRGLLLLAAVIALALASPQAARAGGVVTACNEAGLKSELFGGGTVTFSCSGTITVLGGTITIAENTMIDGSGQNITISGGGKIQLFVVNSDRTLNLKNLTVADALSGSSNGGGVLNNGTLNVTNCTFRGNTVQTNSDAGAGGNGGGIYNQGQLTVTNSTFEGNTASGFSQSSSIAGAGGGIFNDNDATITNSSFHGNSAVSGGAIFTGSQSDGGLLLVSSSVFYNNHVTGSPDDGPGLGGGGGIFKHGIHHRCDE